MTKKIDQAIAQFQKMNALDPTLVADGRADRPKELVHAERLARWVERVEPNASDALRLAAQSQHLMRWKSPRKDYPEGRVGYLKWRKDLLRMQADRATDVLKGLDHPKELIAALRKIHLKQELKMNADSQAMEDALCLSFLEHDFAEFAAKYDDQKVIDVVQKTWRKMSNHGHALALTIPLSGREKNLVARALAL